jgi:hypothetical protein
MLLLTLRGTPTLYYGEEIVMEDGDIPLDKLVDPAEINAPGLGLGRDPERTPMQWDNSPNAGFSLPGVSPWLPGAENYKLINVAEQQGHANSMLTFTRRMIAFRQQSQALLSGDYRPLEAGEEIVAYIRETESERLAVILNLGYMPRTFSLEKMRRFATVCHGLGFFGPSPGPPRLLPREDGRELVYRIGAFQAFAGRGMPRLHREGATLSEASGASRYQITMRPVGFRPRRIVRY